MFARILDTPKKRIAAAVVGVVLLAGAVAAFALGGGEEEAAPTTTTAPPTTTTTVPPVLAPLTGLPTTKTRAALPALVVKIDNDNKRARPQVGLNQADIVYEERVEGSVTRFLAVFHSRDSKPVGPVRSARTSDIPIVSALNRPFYAWSGANTEFARRIRASNLVDVGFDARRGEYFREPSRSAPHNLMLRQTRSILLSPSPGSGPPLPPFEFREPEDVVRGGLRPTEGAAVSYGGGPGGAPTEWRWNGSGGWARSQAGTPHFDAATVRVAPANVIIQFVDYVPTDIVDQFGVRIPEAKLVGFGEAWILTSGGGEHGVIKGTWSKGALGNRTRYSDVNGNPIKLLPGTTWVVLPTAGGARLL